MPERSKYAPLGRYLAAQPPEVRVVVLTFAALERVLGAPLPPSTRTRRWWSNSLRMTRHAWAWLDAGWRVQQVNRRQVPLAVTFVRADTTG